MRLNDLFYILLINHGVPHTLWIYHHHWTLCATIKATSFVNPDLSGACQTKLSHTILGVLKQRKRIMPITTIIAIAKLV